MKRIEVEADSSSFFGETPHEWQKLEERRDAENPSGDK
jgi:hypothetical protein